MQLRKIRTRPEELAVCGRDFRRAQEVTDRLAALSAESEALYEEYGGLID